MKNNTLFATLLLGLILSMNINAIGQTGSIKGSVTDSETKESLPFTDLGVFNPDGAKVALTKADRKGKYEFKELKPGKYQIRATFVGYKPVIVKDISIQQDSIKVIDIRMKSEHYIDIGQSLITSH